METTLANIQEQVPHIMEISLPEIEVIGIDTLANGVTNPVFIIRQANGEDLVLRVLNPIAGDWKPKKEEAVYALLAVHGIPVPTVIKTDTSKSIIPFNFAISIRLQGKTMSDAYDAMTIEERLELYEEFGEIVGNIHSITFDMFGDVEEIQGEVGAGKAHEITDASSELNAGPFRTWKEMHSEIVKARLHYFANTAFAELINPIREYFSSHSHLLDFNITPRLLHMDLHRGNIFMNHGHINGIIDVESAMIGHNEYDLMRTQLAHFGGEDGERLKEAFLKGYTKVIPLDDGYESRLNFYRLSRTLVHINCLILLGEKYSKNLEEDTIAAIALIKELIHTT